MLIWIIAVVVLALVVAGFVTLARRARESERETAYLPDSGQPVIGNAPFRRIRRDARAAGPGPGSPSSD